MTRKGIIAFSCFWVSDIVLDPQLPDHCEPPGIMPTWRFGMIAKCTHLSGKRIEFLPPGVRHRPHAPRQPDAPTHDMVSIPLAYVNQDLRRR